MGATILRPLLRLGRITNPFLARPTYLKPTDQPMYAVVDDRNQQFRAEPGERVQVPHNESWEPGTKVTFDKVCLVTGDKRDLLGMVRYEGGRIVTVRTFLTSYGRLPRDERP